MLVKPQSFTMVLVCAAVLACVSQERRAAMASDPSKLEYFLHLNQDVVQRTQMKLTYVGPQEKATPSVGIVPEGKAFELRPFQKLRHPGVNYGNDDVVKPELCVLAPGDYQKAYSATMEALKGSAEETRRPFLSVATVQDAGTEGAEVLLDRQRSEALWNALISAISPDNSEARATLQKLGSRVF